MTGSTGPSTVTSNASTSDPGFFQELDHLGIVRQVENPTGSMKAPVSNKSQSHTNIELFGHYRNTLAYLNACPYIRKIRLTTHLQDKETPTSSSLPEAGLPSHINFLFLAHSFLTLPKKRYLLLFISTYRRWGRRAQAEELKLEQ